MLFHGSIIHRYAQLWQQLTLTRIVLIFLLLMLPTVFAPFHADDFFHLLLLDDNSPLQRSGDGSLFGLFSFVDKDPLNRAQLMQYGVLPWWVDDAFFFRFWRPLAELSHWLDYQLLPRSAMLAHLHSLAWFLALIWPLQLLIRETLSPPKLLLLLALAVFVLDGQHVMTISWIANRNAIIAAFFALWALLFHSRAPRRATVINTLAAVVCYSLALAAGEIALSLLAYVSLYTLMLDQRSWAQRWLSLIPFWLISLLYLYGYQQLGFGAQTSSTFYISPISEPQAFLWAALERFPVYVLAAFAPVIAGSSWIGGDTFPLLTYTVLSASLLALSLLVYLCWRYRDWLQHHRELSFWLAAGLLSILPVCSALAQDRLTLFQTVGVDIFIAAIIYYGIFERASNRALQKLASVFVVFHLLLSPLHLLAGSAFIHIESQRLLDHAVSFSGAAEFSDKQVLIFTMPMGQASTLMGMREAVGASVPDSVFIVAGVEGDLQVLRHHENALLIKRQAGISSGHETSFRATVDSPFVEGQRIVQGHVQIIIDAVDSMGRAEVWRLQFLPSLQHHDWLFYQMDSAGNLVPTVLPALGETRVY